MGWSRGAINGREVGYAVEAECDFEGCEIKINRGFSYLCGVMHGGEDGCGNYYCAEHRYRHDCEWLDELYEDAEREREAYIAAGKCSQCGATSAAEAMNRCKPQQDPSGEYRCAGDGLWPEEE